jgi:hypothetical protein
MTSSMLLTLYVVPVFYTLVAGARRRLGWRVGPQREEEPDRALRATEEPAPEPLRKSA